MHEFKIDTTPRSWDDALKALTAPVAAPVAPVAPEALAPKAPWHLRVAEFLSSRARDLALILIILGTFVAVFQGSLISATLFGFSGISAVAFALMPDALMIISASKMRGKDVSPVQRREARFSMHFSLAFSLLSNMIAALYVTMPELFTPGALVAGAVSYHGVIVVFLWRAVETSTKTRQDAPSVRRSSTKAPEAAATKPKAKAPAVKTVTRAKAPKAQVK